MLVLPRAYFDGPDNSELVMIHYSAAPQGSPSEVLARGSLVAARTPERGKREARLFLPDPPAGGRLSVTYRFSSVRGGAEWFSPAYTVVLPPEQDMDGFRSVAEEGGGNLRPAAGRGTFLLDLPLREGEAAAGTVRYGFGAMRKKPSPSLCRAAVPAGAGRAAVVEVPEALSVLKNRPMPFFLYHQAADGGELFAEKINCARVTWTDVEGDVACARLLWSGRSWTAQNVAPMEAPRLSAPGREASGYPFAGDPAAFLDARLGALRDLPVPRTFEAFVFGPAGSVVEYCILLLRVGPRGSVSAEWRNLEGGNWKVAM